MGVVPHLLYQAAHEGRARLLRGCPPLSFWLEGSPPLYQCSCMPCAGSARCSGGAPSPVDWSVPSPSLSCMPCAGSARSSGGTPVASSGFGPPPFPCMPCAGSARCSGGAPSSSLWFRESTPFLAGTTCAESACCHLGGSPPSSGPACARWVHAACSPPPPTCARVARAPGDEGPLLCPGPGRVVVSRAAVFRGPPLCPRCALWARAAGWGVPPLLPPHGGCTR